MTASKKTAVPRGDRVSRNSVCTRFAQTLHTHRKSLSLSLRTAAKACGCSSTYLCDLEKGRQSPTLDMIHKLKTGIGFPVEALAAILSEATS